MMRECYVYELLIDILHYPFIIAEKDLSLISKDDPYHWICVLAHTLIKLMSQDYWMNELYASQWIELFFE